MKIKKRSDKECLRLFKKINTKVVDSLNEWAFQDINRAIRGGAKRGAFILASCFIDYLTCFYHCQCSTEAHYINFVNTYMPDYDGKKLYKSLRCRLVHNYSLDQYALTHHHSKLHLKTDKESGLQIINLRSFINDIKDAEDKYLQDLYKNKQLQINFYKWYVSSGILLPKDI